MPLCLCVQKILSVEFNKGYADEGGKGNSRGIGCKVDPIDTSATTGAILLKQFDAATHDDGHKPCPDAEPHAVVCLLVL